MFEVLDQDTILIIVDMSKLSLTIESLNDVALTASSKSNLNLAIDLDAKPSGVSEEDVLTLIRGENVFANYKTQQYDESVGVSYVGKVKTSGEWLISKIDDLDPDLTVNYANESNNVTMISFNLAWTNRAVLNYTLISNLSGL